VQVEILGIHHEIQNPADYFRHGHAYSPGLQEYVEAASFYHYIQHGTLVSFSEINQAILRTQQQLLLQSSTPSTSHKNPTAPVRTTAAAAVSTTAPAVSSTSASIPNVLSPLPLNTVSSTPRPFVIPLTDYLLGLTDLSGELMRYAINSVSTHAYAITNASAVAPVRSVADVCDFLAQLYSQFRLLSSSSALRLLEWDKKLAVMLQSLTKVENVCYRMEIRGREYPATMLSRAVSSDGTDGGVDDEYDGTAF